MFLTLRMPWIMVDTASHDHRPILVPPGTYAVERIPRPHASGANPWLIISGTTVGLNERLVDDMSRGEFGDFRLTAEPAHSKPGPGNR